jgi:hypothetical protein
VELALCDHQVLLAVAGETVFGRSYTTSAGQLAAVTRPIGIGASGLSAQVSELIVWRDLYYLDPLNTGRPWSLDRRLASDEFFALGDNAPISRDSRFWPAGSVTRKTLLGSVLARPR